MGIRELKQYVVYSPPWFDSQGSACVDPSFGVSASFIKMRLKIKVPFSQICEKFESRKWSSASNINYILPCSGVGRISLPPSVAALHSLPLHEQDTLFANTISFLSQDGLIFHLFGTPEGDSTWIWQVYFDENYKYPPNIKDARKESTAFKKWLLTKI